MCWKQKQNKTKQQQKKNKKKKKRFVDYMLERRSLIKKNIISNVFA